MIIIKSPMEIKYMEEAGRIVAQSLELVKGMIKPGTATMELCEAAEEFIIRCGANPAFKGYKNFPSGICTSVNEQVVHGIPGNKALVEGDIISVDIGAVVKGYYGDAAKTFPVGSVSSEASKLLAVTEESLNECMNYAKEGYRLSDISHAIQSYVEKEGFSVIRDYVGHGIGQQMHEDPQIPNFGEAGKGPRLRRGMTLAIEPMVNIGTYSVHTLKDNWTVVTSDGSLSAHFEHTVLITDGLPRILTKL